MADALPIISLVWQAWDFAIGLPIFLNVYTVCSNIVQNLAAQHHWTKATDALKSDGNEPQQTAQSGQEQNTERIR